jgi:integrase
MARRSEGPRFYSSKNAYFANIKGERIRLCDGPKNKVNGERAQAVYDRLAKVRSAEIDGDRAEVGVILTAYLQSARTRTLPPPLSPGTYRNHLACIQNFVGFTIDGKTIGSMPYRDLKMEHVNRWIASRKTEGRVYGTHKVHVQWGENYVHLQLRILRTAFRWAMHEDLVSESVFARRGKVSPFPKADFSMRRLAIEPQEHATLLAQANRRKRGDFGAFLDILYWTGARPAEIYMATAEEWDEGIQSFVLEPGSKSCVGRLKTRRHLKSKGRKRIIRIPDVILPTVKGLLAKHPSGPIVRKEDGSPWGDSKSAKSVRSGKIATRFTSLVRAAGKKQKVRQDLTLYSYRHAFVTRWLKSGRSAMELCELLNTSLEMLQTHYSHLFEEHRALLGSVNDFSSQEARASQRASS